MIVNASAARLTQTREASVAQGVKDEVFREQILLDELLTHFDCGPADFDVGVSQACAEDGTVPAFAWEDPSGW